MHPYNPRNPYNLTRTPESDIHQSTLAFRAEVVDPQGTFSYVAIGSKGFSTWSGEPFYGFVQLGSQKPVQRMEAQSLEHCTCLLMRHLQLEVANE